MIPYLKFYDSFLKKNANIIADPKLFPIENYSPREGRVYIKHDVECKLDLALQMAKIESNNNISSIWLFQKNLLIEANISDIKMLISMGHIVGYHYDVLDSNRGSFEIAKREFDEVISWLEENIYKINYVCPHGNPSLTRIGYESNKDFWKKYSYNYDLYDLVMDFKGDFYSDVSYGFFKIIRSEVNKNNELKISVNFNDVNFDGLTLVSLHSHRWSNSLIKAYFNYLIFVVFKFIFQKLKKIPFIGFLGNKFYGIAKYI